jgi:hypothetical protein
LGECRVYDRTPPGEVLSCARLMAIAVDNVRAFLAGQPSNVVN